MNASHHITSHHITSHHITSHHTRALQSIYTAPPDHRLYTLSCRQTQRQRQRRAGSVLKQSVVTLDVSQLDKSPLKLEAPPKAATSTHQITSRHITSHHITSHHLTSHHITSHHTRALQSAYKRHMYHPAPPEHRLYTLSCRQTQRQRRAGSVLC